MSNPRKIVVGVDGSSQSEAALRWAIHEAVREGDQVRAVLVRGQEDLLPGTSFATQPHGRRPVPDESDYVERLRASVAAARDELPSPPPVTNVLLSGIPATVLIKESQNADLLVVGSHGARQLSELLLGSVATQCVRHAHCPVVVITAESAQRWRPQAG